MTPERTISALCQRSRDISLEKGWLNPDGTDPRPFHTVIGLFHTELSEAFEDIRSHKGLNETYYEVKHVRLGNGIHLTTVTSSKGVEELRADKNEEVIGVPKPCGIPIELADFVIRVCQYYGSADKGAALQADFKEGRAWDDYMPVDAEELIARLHAKASHAYQQHVEGRQDGVVGCLADALSELFAFCQKNDVNLWNAIDEKEAYNRTRPQKHGGKKM